jgi:thioredoxin reductase (NADPH)
MSAAIEGVEAIELLVVGAGPTGIAIGAEAKRAGLDCLLVDRGGLTQALLDFPEFMTFFTSRDLLEIAGIPFTVPDEKPDRRQALAYYRAVAQHYGLRLALHEEVTAVRCDGAGFEVLTRRAGHECRRQAAAVAFATGYFGNPRRLGVPGEDAAWVTHRYRSPFHYFGERVAIIGGGNSAVEAALELYRAGVETTLVVRSSSVKKTIKYWLQPDLENRLAAGSIRAYFDTRVTAIGEGIVAAEGPRGAFEIPADRVLVLAGYTPEVALFEGAGVRVDPGTLVPEVNPDTCESNVAGLFVAGTLQAGRDTGRIFIENSRDHGRRIVERLQGRR